MTVLAICSNLVKIYSTEASLIHLPDWVIQEVQDRLNERPRNILEFDTPKERIAQLVAL